MRYIFTNHNRRLFVSALLSLCVLTGCGGGGSTPATRYVLTDLTPNGNFARPFTINSGGQVGGYFTPLDAIRSLPFVWTAQKGLRLASLLPEAAEGVVRSINDQGQYVGTQNIGQTENATFWDSSGAVASLGSVVQQGNNTYILATNINNQGQIVGISSSGAYLWNTAGQQHDLGALIGGKVTAIGGLNDQDQIVATTTTNGNMDVVLYTPGRPLATITPPAGHTALQITGINNQGVVTGYTVDGECNGCNSGAIPADVGFIWMAGKGLTQLGASVQPDAINAGNQVVGAYGAHAFVWSVQTGLHDLNSLIPSGSGVVLTEATAINAGGQIVAVGISGAPIAGVQHAYLLTPQ